MSVAPPPPFCSSPSSSVSPYPTSHPHNHYKLLDRNSLRVIIFCTQWHSENTGEEKATAGDTHLLNLPPSRHPTPPSLSPNQLSTSTPFSHPLHPSKDAAILFDWLNQWLRMARYPQWIFVPPLPPPPQPPLPFPQIMIKKYTKKLLLHIFWLFDYLFRFAYLISNLTNASVLVCVFAEVCFGCHSEYPQMGFYFSLHLCFMCHVQQRLRRNYIYLFETTPIFTLNFIICSQNPILFARPHLSSLSSSVVRIASCSQDLTNLYFHHL